ncbi:hypothetical protein J1N35_025573, partial [Gossypium stocksii]
VFSREVLVKGNTRRTETELKSSSTQSTAQESNSKMDPKASDPAMDAEGFVMVPSSNYRPDKKEETESQNPKESNHRTEHYPVRGISPIC